jgi:E3 ubiquitin ligase
MLQTVGLVVVTLGIIGFIWGIFQKLKAGRVADAPLASTGDVVRRGRELAGPKGQISAQGNVVCHQPLLAPFSGQPCLYYKLTCKAEWKEGDTHKSKVLDEQKCAAEFAIDDGSGPVPIDAREGGDYEPTQTKRETKGTGIIGGITGTEIAFGNYRVQTGMLALGTKYTVEEEILPAVPRLYACGKLADHGGAIASPNWRQLILSQKSRDELLSSAAKGAKIFLAAGAAAFFVGSGMAAVGQFVLHSNDADAPVATVTPSATAPSATVAVPPPSAEATSASAAATGTTKTTSAAMAKASGTSAKPDAGAAKSGAADAGAAKASGADAGAAKKK